MSRQGKIVQAEGYAIETWPTIAIAITCIGYTIQIKSMQLIIFVFMCFHHIVIVNILALGLSCNYLSGNEPTPIHMGNIIPINHNAARNSYCDKNHTYLQNICYTPFHFYQPENYRYSQCTSTTFDIDVETCLCLLIHIASTTQASSLASSPAVKS